MAKGRDKFLKEMIVKKLEKGKTAGEISEILEIEPEEVQKLIAEIEAAE